MPRWTPILFAALSVVACSAVPKPGPFAHELVARSPPARSFQAVGEELLLDQATVEALKSQIDGSDGRLMALLQLPQGIHPYLVLVFIEREDSIEVASTEMFWGMVRSKWFRTVDTETAESIISAASRTFECESGPIADFLFGAALVHWPSGEQIVCDGGWLSGEGTAVAEQAQPILDGSELTYAGEP